MSESATRLIQFQRLGIIILALVIIYQSYTHKQALREISPELPNDVEAHIDSQDPIELQTKLRGALFDKQFLEEQIADL